MGCFTGGHIIYLTARRGMPWFHEVIAHYSVQMSSFFLKICVEVDKPFLILAKETSLENSSCAHVYGG